MASTGGGRPDAAAGTETGSDAGDDVVTAGVKSNASEVEAEIHQSASNGTSL